MSKLPSKQAILNFLSAVASSLLVALITHLILDSGQTPKEAPVPHIENCVNKDNRKGDDHSVLNHLKVHICGDESFKEEKFFKTNVFNYTTETDVEFSGLLSTKTQFYTSMVNSYNQTSLFSGIASYLNQASVYDQNSAGTNEVLPYLLQTTPGLEADSTTFFGGIWLISLAVPDQAADVNGIGFPYPLINRSFTKKIRSRKFGVWSKDFGTTEEKYSSVTLFKTFDLSSPSQERVNSHPAFGTSGFGNWALDSNANIIQQPELEASKKTRVDTSDGVQLRPVPEPLTCADTAVAFVIGCLMKRKQAQSQKAKA